MPGSQQHRAKHPHDDNGKYSRNKQSQDSAMDDPISGELRASIRNMVMNISKSFIVSWYTIISQTNDDFVASCEQLIENAMIKFAELCVTKLDRYKTGKLVAGLLHDHILNENSTEKLRSIECQIDDHEYDICQSVVVRLFGLLSDENLRRVIFTPYPEARSRSYHQNKSQKQNELYQGSSTSALYTLVIAMLTKATFMPIIDTISSPKWLFAVIIWLCQQEEQDQARKEAAKNFTKQQKGTKIISCNNCNNDPSIEKTFDRVHKPTPIPETSIIVTAPTMRSSDLENGINLANSINFPTPVSESLIRPIDNVEIYATEEVKSNNSCYVLYCISFGGLCHRHPSAGSGFMLPDSVDISLIDKRGSRYTRTLDSNEPSKLATTSTASSTNQNPDISYRKSYRRKMTIKRRFREFVILQLRLEENPKIRPYMKNIPKPTKLKAATQNIFSLPGITNIKLDQGTIKLRQNFLERFLLALNNCPFIANSYEFKEFFSYNMNPNPTQISKSKSLILQVNLNKVFVGSVKGAFSMLEALLPGEDNRLRSGPEHDPDAWLTELQQSTMKLHIQTRTSHSKMPLERFLDSKLSSVSDSLYRQDKSSSLGRFSERSGVHFERSRGGSLKAQMVKSYSIGSSGSSPTFMSRSSSSASRNTGETSRSSSTDTIYYDAPNDLGNTSDLTHNSIQICDSLPIASKLIDILHYSLSGNSNCSNSSLSYCARFMLGKMIERRAAQLLSLLNVNVATFCMNGITDAIWGESANPPLDVENSSLDEAVKHLTKLLENSSTLPYIPRPLLHSFISSQTRFYLSQLSSQKRNKFVIYSFFVNLLDELEPVDQ